MEEHHGRNREKALRRGNDRCSSNLPTSPGRRGLKPEEIASILQTDLGDGDLALFAAFLQGFHQQLSPDEAGMLVEDRSRKQRLLLSTTHQKI